MKRSVFCVLAASVCACSSDSQPVTNPDAAVETSGSDAGSDLQLSDALDAAEPDAAEDIVVSDAENEDTLDFSREPDLTWDGDWEYDPDGWWYDGDYSWDSDADGGDIDWDGDVGAAENPCENADSWPYFLESETYSFLVHYQQESDSAVAEEVLGYVEYAWDFQVGGLGFSAPLPDESRCGPDERFDVFLQRGIDIAYVEVLAPNRETEWYDYTVFLVVDPWGPYGGELLGPTVSHEFNHACQAADDWWEVELVFEMTSTYIEDIAYDGDNGFYEILRDFQSRPSRSLDWYDGYRTWYMYGAALYMHFVSDRYFAGNAGFAADMWRESRNPARAANEPDYQDALDVVLGEVEATFMESVVEFARWRWYTGERDDGNHFDHGADFPNDTAVAIAESVGVDAGRVEIARSPMLLGSVYIEVSADDESEDFQLAIDGEHELVRWVVQALPGLDDESDGELIDLSDGPATVRLGPDSSRTIVITAMPSGDYDPDDRENIRYPVALIVGGE
jgi:hypothetical protein